MTKGMQWLLFMVVFLVGCTKHVDEEKRVEDILQEDEVQSSEQSPDDEPDEPRDEPVDPWDEEDCHLDCFGERTCQDGVATAFAVGPFPCSYTACPVEQTYACRFGCRESRVRSGGDPFELCWDSQPNKEGDPCSAEKPCIPPRSTWQDGVLTHSYLACDEALGLCVEEPPPEIHDFRETCGLGYDRFSEVPSVFWEERFVEVDASLCSGGACYVSYGSGGCISQACTSVCESNQDCPQGSPCVSQEGAGSDEPSFCWVGGVEDYFPCECGLLEEVSSFIGEDYDSPLQGAGVCGVSLVDSPYPEIWSCLTEAFSAGEPFVGYESLDDEPSMMPFDDVQAIVGTAEGAVWLYRYEWECCGEPKGPGVVRAPCLDPKLKAITAAESSRLRPEGTVVIECAPFEGAPEVICEG